MKSLKCIVLLLIIVSSNSYAGLTTGITMDVLLSELENKANSIITNAQNATDNIVNNAAYNAVNAIAQVRIEYEDALYKTSKELTMQQRMVFEGLESRINLLFKNIESEHNRIDNSLDNLANYLSDTVFMSDEPRISRFLSNIGISGRKETKPLLVKFRGKNLNHKKNNILVGGKSIIKPNEIADNLLSFTMPWTEIKDIVSNDKITLVPVELTIHENYLLFFTEKKTYKYNVRLIPNMIAQAVIHYKETKREVVDRKSKTTGGPTGSLRSGRTSRRCTNVSMNAYPDDGYKIDTSSARMNWGGSDHCSGGSTRCSISPSSSIAKGSCSICTERGRGGKVTCNYSTNIVFTQYKEVDKTYSYYTEKMSISYESPLSWNIPSGKIFSHIELTFFDGRKIILEKEGSTQLIDLSIDPYSRTIVVAHNLNIDVLN